MKLEPARGGGILRFKTVVAPLDSVMGVKSCAFVPGFVTTRCFPAVSEGGFLSRLRSLVAVLKPDDHLVGRIATEAEGGRVFAACGPTPASRVAGPVRGGHSAGPRSGSGDGSPGPGPGAAAGRRAATAARPESRGIRVRRRRAPRDASRAGWRTAKPFQVARAGQPARSAVGPAFPAGAGR